VQLVKTLITISKHQTHCNRAYNFHRAGEAMHLVMDCIIQPH
jgi:hypothetical protein